MKIKLISASENTVYVTDELRGKCAALITSPNLPEIWS